MKIEGKVAIVTGGASGLGRATAEALIANGAKVAIWDLNEELGTQAAAELGENAMFIKINVTDEAAVEAAVQTVVEKFGAVHILANIAGIARPRLVINKEGPTSLKDFTDVIDIDLVAPYNIIRHVAWAMSKNEPVTEDGERGVIINTSSAAADHGQRGQQSYSAAKGGLNSMALPIARGLARNGIRIAGISPGFFETPIYGGNKEKMDAYLKDAVFPVRFGKPHEFASLLLEIVRNSMINGTTIRLDGAVRF
ncbi:MAG: SDR family NAD(P)-dependent oxidoreductase [Oscillospiraceae bacterium]|nr:SDR family NAD(P)-dependent oxidoreductase [Oscillospiraceae bacterium]